MSALGHIMFYNIVLQVFFVEASVICFFFLKKE